MMKKRIRKKEMNNNIPNNNNLNNIPNNNNLEINLNNNLEINENSVLNNNLPLNIKRKPTFKPFDIKEHDFETLQILHGSLLGDGRAEKLYKSTRFKFKQCGDHKEYLLWLHDYFAKKGYCSKEIPIIKQDNRKSKITGMNFTYIYFQTYSFDSLNFIQESWYPNNKKIVPSNISSYLSPLALAIWIMDDGTWAESGLILCTDSFTKIEVDLLRTVLKDNFNLVTTMRNIRPNQYRIYIRKESIEKLREIVLPYMHKIFLYKLGIEKSKNTTIIITTTTTTTTTTTSETK
jgi:hypothetical protein